MDVTKRVGRRHQAEISANPYSLAADFDRLRRHETEGIARAVSALKGD